MNERDIERHVSTLVDCFKALDAPGAKDLATRASVQKTAEASAVALVTNFLINAERQATALERIADVLEEKNK